MRFKNLTIILTLTCLSLVALAGLVILPITGNCELFKHGRYYFNDNTATNFMVTEDSKGASWQIYAYIDAKGVSASISPDEYNVSHFTKNRKFTGTGLVTTFRDNYTWYHDLLSGTPFISFVCNNFSMDPSLSCLGHEAPGEINTNHPASPYYNGEDTALILDIQMSKVVKHICRARKRESREHLTVTLEKGDPIVGKGSKFRVGSTTYVAINESVKATVHIFTVVQQGGVNASVEFNKEANSSAHVDIFDFEGFSESGSVWYNAP